MACVPELSGIVALLFKNALNGDSAIAKLTSSTTRH
jgi:hypothetical protein